jgi:hypothetical protein
MYRGSHQLSLGRNDLTRSGVAGLRPSATLSAVLSPSRCHALPRVLVNRMGMRALPCHRASPASSPASTLILGPGRHPARDVLVGIARSRAARRLQPATGVGQYAPACIRYWQMRPVFYRIPSPSQSFLKCVLSIQRF